MKLTVELAPETGVPGDSLEEALSTLGQWWDRGSFSSAGHIVMIGSPDEDAPRFTWRITDLEISQEAG